MGNHEFFQAAPQLLHQAKELVDLGSRSNLLQTLTDLGHPYGLLLGQANSSNPIDSFNDFFKSIFKKEPFNERKGEAKASFKKKGTTEVDPNIAASSVLIPCSWPFLASAILEWLGPSVAPFLSSASLNTPLASLKYSLIGDRKDKEFGDEGFIVMYAKGLGLTSLSKGSILGSAKSSPESARKIHMEELFREQAFLAPIFLKLFAEEKPLSQRSRELQIGKNSVSLGTTAIKLATYRGEQPFLVKTPQGESIAQINPGDQLGHLHVSHQASLMRGLSPLEKAEQITQDFIELFKAVNNGGVNLDTKQQEVLAKAQNATLIGISHLVRLFRRKTGLPTWKLDVLPELVQKFHQHDSQAVSRAFGGSRKVRPNDVEMMVVTPEMRRQLVATV